MGGLKALPSRLKVAPSRLLPKPTSDSGEHSGHRVRPTWHGWYNTARWRALRKVVLRRDKSKCQQTGALLCGKYPAPNSAAIDHIVPHKGDPDLFWNIDNLQSVTKAWHDSVKQAEEKNAPGWQI